MGAGTGTFPCASRGTTHLAADLCARTDKAVRQQVRFVPEVRDMSSKMALEQQRKPMGETWVRAATAAIKAGP
eukprot:3546896-Amphidinium_carterae.1